MRLTVEFAHGKNIPRQKRPSRGPPIIPKMLNAACRQADPQASAKVANSFHRIRAAQISPREPGLSSANKLVNPL